MRRRETGKLRCREHWRPGLGYSSQYSSQKGLSFFFKGRGKMSWFMRSDGVGAGADELEPAEVPKASDLRREERRETWYEISILVLNPNEVSRTRPISMARLDLRFIILGGGDP
jgi:hypothetical protein